MVVHTFAYYKSKNTTAEEEIDVVPDDVLTRTAATRFMIPPGMTKLYWGFAGGYYLGEARLYTPSLETRKYKLRIIPKNVENVNISYDYGYVFKPSPPVSFVATEELSYYASITNATAARDVVGVFTIGPDALPPVPPGEPIWVKCTGTTTLVPFRWTSVKLTPEVQLEAGTYALLNAIAISPGAIAVRFIIPGLVWRPGFPAVAAANEYAGLALYRNLKDQVIETEYGRFSHLAIPEAQFLSSSADTSEVVYLKIVKVA
ncbi:MAG: hypothetical protein QXZ10_04325 [Sulfolobales archaeon]